MTTGGEDKRVTKTRRNIEQSFMRLLDGHPFEKITVKMIQDEALISKGTFYAHYLDKYDLAERVVRARVEELCTGVRTRGEMLMGGGSRKNLLASLRASLGDIESDYARLSRIRLEGVDFEKEVFHALAEEIGRCMASADRGAADPASEARTMALLCLAYLKSGDFLGERMEFERFVDEVASVSKLYGSAIGRLSE